MEGLSKMVGSLFWHAPRWLVPVLTLILAGFYLFVGFAYGPIFTSDGMRDLAYARVLVDLNFAPGAYLAEVEDRTGRPLSVPLQFYMGYVYVLAVLERLLGDRWLEGLVVFNALAYAISSGLILMVIQTTLRSVFSIVLAAGFLALAFDGYQWVAMSQSTAMFMPVATAVLFFGTRAMTSDTGWPWWGLAVFGLAIAVITRPTWPPVAATVLLLGLVSLSEQFEFGKNFRGWKIVFLAASIGGVGLVAITALGYLNPTIIPVSFLREFAEYWRSTYETGVVVYDRPGTYLTPDTAWWGFARLELARLGYFFWFLADDFSPAHQWLNISGHVPLYGLALIGGFFVLRRPQELSRIAVTTGLAAMMYLLIIDVFHAVTFLDYDWRYRAPAYPWIIFLAAIGGTKLVAAWTGGPTNTISDRGS